MNIAAHWFIQNQPGSVIDLIEAELHDFTDAHIERTETINAEHNYDATYIVKGDISAEDLIDACEYMDGIGAYPI